MTGKNENRGGPRPGSGRPRKKKTVSETVKANYLEAAHDLAKEYGEPIEKAINVYHPALKKKKNLEAVGEYRNIEELI